MADKTEEKVVTIDQLTPEQEEMIKQVADKWRLVQDNRGPADFETGRRAVTKLYANIGWPTPNVFVYTPNCLAFAVACHLMRDQSDLIARITHRLSQDKAPQSEYDSVLKKFQEKVIALNNGRWGPIQTKLGINEGIKNVWDAYVVAVNEGLVPTGKTAKLVTLMKHIDDIKECCTPKQLEQEYFSTLRGQHDVGWGAYIEIFENLSPGVAEKALPILDLTRSVGWWVPYETAVVFTDRFSGIHFSTENPNDLHRLDGPAIEFRDGFGIYCIEGQIVPPHVVLDPKSITIEEIKKEDNAEVRRILRQQLTDEVYISRINPTVIDMDMVSTNVQDKNAGAIQRALLQDDTGDRFLVGSDGSTKRVYYMYVPRNVKTCVEAYAALFPGNSDKKCIAQT